MGCPRGYVGLSMQSIPIGPDRPHKEAHPPISKLGHYLRIRQGNANPKLTHGQNTRPTARCPGS